MVAIEGFTETLRTRNQPPDSTTLIMKEAEADEFKIRVSEYTLINGTYFENGFNVVNTIHLTNNITEVRDYLFFSVFTFFHLSK